MNLHGMVAPYIAAVNPMIAVTIQFSQRNTVADDGTPTPLYSAPVAASAQIQPLTYRDLQQLDGINLQGTRYKFYLYGQVDGVVRAESKGGDLITVPPGNRHAGVYLVAQVLEQFPDWVSCACTLQNGS